ncbi:MAG: thioredoxin-like domain-containing protein [Limisphaerales bacterium]
MFARALTFLLTLTLLAPLCAEDSPLKSNAKVVVLVFVSSECPISNKFAPELERLSHKFPTNEVSFNLVYPNASDSESKIAEHRRDFNLTGTYLRDPNHTLTKTAHATITPEAAVFDAHRNLVYRGRVNDQYLALGKGRPEPTQHDLEDAIKATLDGHKPKHAHIEAIGCFIQD